MQFHLAPQALAPDMQTIEVQLRDGSYPVYLGHEIIADGRIWQKHIGKGKTLVVSNEVVAPLFLEPLHAALSGRELDVHILPDGERFKTLDSWSGIIDHLVEFGARRDATVIALGGGVIGDMSGFAAASYMRGITFLQVPTTLLAQVDASVGGKTGVNHKKGKNLIGAFHQPAAVVIDTATLATLKDREFNAGLAEVVKYGAIMDPVLFDWLEASAAEIRLRQLHALQHLIHRSVLDKSGIVARDERESGIRAILNFGHTFAHALETTTGYAQFLHGEAVAIGMVIATRLSELRGLCAEGTAARISDLLKLLDLPVELPRTVNTRAMIDAMGLDKKALASGLRLILLNRLGEALIDDQSTRADVATAIDHSHATSTPS
jgi:3-dehydroquinate synthase